jgi:hypothetical protein
MWLAHPDIEEVNAISRHIACFNSTATPAAVRSQTIVI